MEETKTKKKKKRPSTLKAGEKLVNIIWQPKYLGVRPEFWLLASKMNRYDTDDGKNATVYVTFEKDLKYGLSGKVWRVRGGAMHVLLECEKFLHERTGCHYYRIPLSDLIEVEGMELPASFLAKVEEYRLLHDKDEDAGLIEEESTEAEEEMRREEPPAEEEEDFSYEVEESEEDYEPEESDDRFEDCSNE